MSKFMKIQRQIEKSVVSGYKGIKNAVVDGYKQMENGFVSGYKKIEGNFVKAFLTPDETTINEKGCE